MNEQDYIRGQEALARRIVGECRRYISPLDALDTVVYMHDVKVKVRDLWDTVSDEPFPEGLHLADVIEQIMKQIPETDSD